MIFDRYIFKNLLLATMVISCVLAVVILLTQSLRFLELVIESGASSTTFFILTALALPRFFEVILPIALMGGCLFIYNKMIMDSELVVMRSAGASPFKLARPALMVSVLVASALWTMTLWVGPASLSNMHKMRQIVKAQYSTLLFREGVFTSVSDGLTVFIRDRDRSGELYGLIIHDNREEVQVPVTVTAKKGMIVSDDNGNQRVVVFDGIRQSLNEKSGSLDRLNFERYTIDLPSETGTVRKRWKEPDERTFLELLNPDPNNKRDVENSREFKLEIHRRLISPILAPCFVMISMLCLLLGPANRRGQVSRLVIAVGSIALIQSLYLASFNFSKNSDWGLILMYVLVIGPCLIGGYGMTSHSESLRRRMLFGGRAL